MSFAVAALAGSRRLHGTVLATHYVRMHCGPACLFRLSIVLACGVALVAGWQWIPASTLDLHEVSARLAPHRDAWYALPMVMLAFIVMGFVPVLLLIAATGLAFGPVLGPMYAMAGCLASASTAFAIGRWLGRSRVERLGGERIARVIGTMRRNGTLAVFLVRKVPAPFALVNIVLGASTVGYREFVIGTVLGMAVIVIALAGFGYQLTEVWRNPSPGSMITAALFIAVPLTLAWLINRAFRQATSAT